MLASYCLNFLHPGYLLADVIEAERKAESVEKMRKKGLPVSRIDRERWHELKGENTTKYDTTSEYAPVGVRGSWIKVEG